MKVAQVPGALPRVFASLRAAGLRPFFSSDHVDFAGPVPIPWKQTTGPRALLGKEATRETVAASHRVDVSKFLDTGYQFRHENLRECAEHILGRTA